ncbi:type ISP restriction/modification enzyme [Candidatus Magnetobacterium casense]|uniref:site-specific DNA-methyltransferase (adenine-specific) n=1 Tax=Candidatus Magnetobacterium casense TaxID=1455061 RepID=A0ABS6S1P6_9BACT|nr:type ISP restriction/modification enzyme [Candidatus Magnetobacterium casensis]MBV6342770.1 N-6 DNA methylase [Candidatus Magnetobacterium casensis]
MLSEYIGDITRTFNRGDAREESYYPALEGLLKEYLCLTGRQDLVVTTLPKKTDGGNPDFRLWDGRQHITGYIEAKEPSTDDLGKTERTEQLKRYLYTFPNLILTNFLEFRLYRNGELIDTATIGSPFVLNALHTTPPADNEPGLRSLLDKFLAFSVPRIYDSSALSRELAKRTRFLKDVIVTNVLGDNEGSTGGGMAGFYEAFRDYLIGSLKKEEFANLYAQTVTYGLFAARMRSDEGFNREGAFSRVPRSLGILRDVFRFVSSADLPRQMEWTIDDISDVLAVTDVKAILHQYFHDGKGEDPIIHFYETFLSEYDPKTREMRGVYYTPQPVVSYIVRSVNNILKDQFFLHDGLAGDDVTLLDPAAGTCTFLAEASKLAIEEYTASYGSGDMSGFIKRHVLQNFYGFELMMAPYAIGHIKMSLMLQELGYTLQDDDRAMLFITNTLDMEAPGQSRLPGMSSLSEESHRAEDIKKKTPILVILGNPPYSGHSSNVGAWISKEIKAYFQVDGMSLKERNPKWLQDDYVKFIRFAQWKIDSAGKGVLAFITNHSYLDSPTFRGMRRSLMNSFDDIYILNLHGNSKRKEKCPDGSKDENVFDIQQGVSIAFFIKKQGTRKRVSYAEIYGERETKHCWLDKNDINTTQWKDIQPKSEYYLFIPRDESLLPAYDKYTKITDIFPVNSVGIVTARDKLTIHRTRDEVWQTVLNFSRLDTRDARQAYSLGIDTRDWKVELAQKDLLNGGLDRKNILPILYRPFDIRFTYYTGNSRGFHCMPRTEIMQHMVQGNIGLITVRQVAEGVFNHAFVSERIIESRVTLSNKGIAFLFPQYLSLSHYEGNEIIKQSNISPNIIKSLSKLYKTEPSPEEIFHYIYAVLYSNTYRTRYAEFLKIDFPRVPFTRDHSVFTRMAQYGKDLVELHLLKAPDLEPPLARFQGNGDNKVIKLRYDNTRQHLYINATQYFEGLPNDVWQYQIGGYQVCEKWLKDRKTRTLSFEEVKSYCKIVTALQKTINIQNEIDMLYHKLEDAL